MSPSSTARGAPEEIIFRKELELLGSHMPNLSLGFMVEERSSREGWYGHMGRIDAIRLPLLAPDFRDREVFCCGPDLSCVPCAACWTPPASTWTTTIRKALPHPAVEEIPAPFARRSQRCAAVPTRPQRRSASPSDVDAECVAGQTVLQTARASGVRIPAACEFGLCGTCKVKKISGEVEMNHNGGILDDEIDDGYILACCSKPLSALEIEA